MEGDTPEMTSNIIKKNSLEDLSKEELLTKCKGLLSIAHKAKQAKTDLQNEVDRCKIEIEKLTNEKTSEISTIQTLQELVNNITEQKLKYITEIDTAEMKYKNATEMCKTMEIEITQNKADIAVKDNRILNITQQLSSLDSEVISLKRQNHRLSEENEQLINQLSELEAKTLEFNQIGLQQREQLCLLEEKFNENNPDVQLYNENIERLNEKIAKLETALQDKGDSIHSECELKLKDLSLVHEKERDKLNVKLRSYKDKILKCADCINQLKNSRFILKKTIKEYSESIPKWQHDIIKASKVLDNQISDFIAENKSLKSEISDLQQRLKLIAEDEEKSKTKSHINTDRGVENYALQIKSLENEKAILVKEKTHARKQIAQLETENERLIDETKSLKTQINSMNSSLQSFSDQIKHFEQNKLKENETQVNSFNLQIQQLNEQIQEMKKTNINLMDVNGLLKEEVETLKISLEQPKDDSENLSDLNVSLQADIVKLETKLAAYKQENNSLLSEIKEYRHKTMNSDALIAELDDAKSKLTSYKTENTELLIEMKEINQVLKERGETISKQQKALSEIAIFVETLEKEIDNCNQNKNMLLKKTAELEELVKIEEQKSAKLSENIKQLEEERDKNIQTITLHESVISQLKNEIEKLKHNHTIELPNDDNMSTSTISKVEDQSRMKDLDESFEEKYSKLRTFALKLKKRLNDTTAQLNTTEQLKSKYENIINENGLESLLLDSGDKTKVPTKETVPHKESITTDLTTKQINEYKDKKENELNKKIDTLTRELEIASAAVKELETVKENLNIKEKELAAEIEAHKTTKDNLDKSRREVKKKSVLSLEMEDYERSMKDLTSKMEDNRKKMVQMESTIDTQQSTMNAMKTQIKLLDDQIKLEESQSRMVKEELQLALNESKEKDNVVQVKNEIIIKLERELEEQKSINEELNVEMTALVGEKEKIICALTEDKVDLNSRLKKIEFKCANLEEKLKTTCMELDDLKIEYTSYKVRAQAVLRQNQTVDHSQEEQLKEEAAALHAQISTLNLKLNNLQDHCATVESSLESERRRLAEAEAEVARGGQRTSRLQADLGRLAQHLDTERDQNKLQISTLTQCYKKQIKDLELRLQRETEELRNQLLASQNIVQDKVNRNEYTTPLGHNDGSDVELDINVSMLTREEGEGSEAAPSPPLSKQYMQSGGSRSPLPLERLLEEGVPDDVPLDATALALTPEQEVADLRRKLQAQLQKVDHVTVLLSESERECARHSQLNELLKAEVRRARGCLERTEHVHNAEYMKNVTLKFLTLSPGDERSRLVPVLQKILTLNPEETHKLNAVAKGVDPSSSRGWGSYLPWPGGKQ